MRLFLSGILLMLVSACLSEPDCGITATNKVQIALKKTGLNGKDTVASVQFKLITVPGTDSTFQKSKPVSSLALPVNPKELQTTFKFEYLDASGTRKDTVTVMYGVQNIIVGPDCGAYTYYSNLKILSTSFHSTRIVNTQLSTGTTVNLEIKF